MLWFNFILGSIFIFIIGEQGWCSGESTRLPPMWPGFDSRSRCCMWVEFVVGSRPFSEGFSLGSPVFLPPVKNQHFQIPIPPACKAHLIIFI